MSAENPKKRQPFSKAVNFVLAMSAMLISIASYYATYIQAVSSEQQVKAMTYPLIQFTTGNYNSELKAQEINLTVRNSGVGPAIIHRLSYHYKEKTYPYMMAFIKACCSDEFKDFRSPENQSKSAVEAQMITSKEKNIILAASGKVELLQLLKHSSNSALWNKLNKARFDLSVSACYCSLLESCYVSHGVGDVREVDSCY